MIDLDDLPTACSTNGKTRTGGGYRRARGWRNHVTEAEVRAAVKSFEVSGGIIRMLPDEIVPPRFGIPWWYGTYEKLSILMEGAPNE